MSLERNAAEMAKQSDVFYLTEDGAGGWTYDTKNASAVVLTGGKLLPHMQAVYVTLGRAGSSSKLTLPDVSEAQGRIYSITFVNGVTYTGVVQDDDESIGWSDITDLDANNDNVLFYSDGRRWLTLADTT